MVMKFAQDGTWTNDTDALYQARDRRILVQRPMRSDAVVIVSIGFQNPAQMRLAQDNDVVHTFTPDWSDQPFGKAMAGPCFSSSLRSVMNLARATSQHRNGIAIPFWGIPIRKFSLPRMPDWPNSSAMAITIFVTSSEPHDL
jgi:hypothetical protein